MPNRTFWYMTLFVPLGVGVLALEIVAFLAHSHPTIPKIITEGVCVCVCVFGFNVAFNNFSVISRRSLVATGSSMLAFIVLLH